MLINKKINKDYDFGITLGEVKKILYDWIFSVEADYSGVDDIMIRKVIIDQLIERLDKIKDL